MSDPFGTAALRSAVLDAWAASPARFREDANAEDDLVRGSYRDRVVVELAQNAADAALAGGEPGRVRLQLAGDVLLVSNTGGPLTAAGVGALATLRASAKRDGAAVGRFGVGFAAVLAVSDEPAVASTSGAVRWSTEAARNAVAQVAGLADEARRRHGQVPVLRLPWPDDAEPQPGFATTVRLPLRDAAAVELVRRELEQVGDVLLLALPALSEIEVVVDGASRVVTDGGRWRVVRRDGDLPDSVLADRPVEERGRLRWSLAWAQPVAGQQVPGTVHAPTPTDEPLVLGALLIATFPLDPGRRHVAPGALTDLLVREAAAAYVDLVADDPLPHVPGPLAASALDASLRAAVVEAMRERELLVTGDDTRVRPADAVVVDAAGEHLRAVLADVLDGVVADHSALRRLGVRRMSLAEVVDQLPIAREPEWWRALYAAVEADGVGAVAESLATLPVPLADGRTVRGPRGVLVPAPGEVVPAGLGRLGLRVVDHRAAHPVLLRLGAEPATASQLLSAPEVRAAVEDAWDGDDPDALAEVVLTLVESARPEPGSLSWLAELPLRDQDGGLSAAGDLVVPQSFFASVVDVDEFALPAREIVDRWSPETLAAVGLLGSLQVVAGDDDAAADRDDVEGIAEWQDWVAAQVGDRSVLQVEGALVRDLDLVRHGAWDFALPAIAGDRAARAALIEPATALLSDGGSAHVTSYAAWWVREHARIETRPTTAYAVPDATDLAGLYLPWPGEVAVDAEVLAAVGVRVSLDALLAEPGGPDDLLARLAGPDAVVDADDLRLVYAALALLMPDDVSPPDRVRVSPGLVVDASDAVVVDHPQHLQLTWAVPPIVVSMDDARPLAEVLDLDTTSMQLGTVALDGGEAQLVPAEAGRVVGAPGRWWRHDALAVNGEPVRWWVDDAGDVHATDLDGLARGLAASSGRWDLRLLLAAVLAQPERVEQLVAEQFLG